MARRTGSHGLPAEYRTPEWESEEWEETLRYLEALGNSRRPVVVAVVDPRQEALERGFKSRLYEQIGFLRVAPSRDERPGVHRVEVDWPHPDQPAASSRSTSAWSKALD